MARKPKTFEIGALIKTWCSIEILANNVEEAVAKAKDLKESAFISYEGQNVDSNLVIVGITDIDSISEVNS